LRRRVARGFAGCPLGQRSCEAQPPPERRDSTQRLVKSQQGWRGEDQSRQRQRTRLPDPGFTIRSVDRADSDAPANAARKGTLSGTLPLPKAKGR